MDELQESTLSLVESKMKLVEDTNKHCDNLLDTIKANIDSRNRLIKEIYDLLKESYSNSKRQ